MMPFQRTCKEVTALVIAREDRALTWRDQIALRFHMAICSACPRFERQVLTMRNALKQWRNYDESSTQTPAPPAEKDQSS